MDRNSPRDCLQSPCSSFVVALYSRCFAHPWLIFVKPRLSSALSVDFRGCPKSVQNAISKVHFCRVLKIAHTYPSSRLDRTLRAVCSSLQQRMLKQLLLQQMSQGSSRHCSHTRERKGRRRRLSSLLSIHLLNFFQYHSAIIT